MLSVHPHALKHGLAPEDIGAAFSSGQDAAMLVDEDPPRWLMVGFDTAGRTVELVVIEQASGGYLVIHAMKARKTSIRQLRRAEEER
ncbi:MAG: hypothetical protein LBK95_19095 [Bifidobacteriaceae bacterium]|nr:hypothetical protein [Bifidobacteriaceae bacterium]